jgi:hypothetical protein
MKRFIVILLLSLEMFALAVADTPYALFVENDHWIYDAMHILSVESRQTTLADRQPLSKGELAEYFSSFDNAVIPQASEPLYRMMQGYFSDHPFLFRRKYFAFDVNGIFTLQGQYVHNPENEVRLDSFLRYNRTPAIVSVPMHVMFTSYADFFVNLSLKKNYWAAVLSYPYTNVPLEGNAFEAAFPTQAGLSLGNSFFNFTIGRGALNIGRSLAGSMLLADSVDRLDYITATFFYKKVRLSLNVVELEPTRFVFSHEAAFRPIEWLAIRLYEGIVLNAPFDPKYLNPMMIFHNFFGWREKTFNANASEESGKSSIGCQFGLGVDIVPVRGLRLYGQYGQNQFQTSFELKRYPAARNIPNSLGGLAGIEYIHPFSFGHLSVTGEFLYANPWMYIMENKYISLYHRRRDTVAGKGKTNSYIEQWVANPYGPDTIGAFLQLVLTEPQKYRAKFGYRFLVKGENEDNFFDPSKEKPGKPGIYYPDANNYEPIAQAKTPSANPSYFHTISLEGTYRVIKSLELNAGLNWTIVSGKKSGHAVDVYSSVKYTIR